jgi:hypothetical protein
VISLLLLTIERQFTKKSQVSKLAVLQASPALKAADRPVCGIMPVIKIQIVALRRVMLIMPVIEAQYASMVPHDHRHINHERAFPQRTAMHKSACRINGTKTISTPVYGAPAPRQRKILWYWALTGVCATG